MDKFDQDNYLKSIYKDLIYLNNDYSITLFYEEITRNIKYELETYKMVSLKTIKNIKERLLFLIDIYEINLDRNKEECKKIDNMINDIYIRTILKTNDSKEFTYYYSCRILAILLYDNLDEDLYIHTLGNFLLISANLIKNNKIKELEIMLNNITFDKENVDNIIYYDLLIGFVKIYIALFDDTKENYLNHYESNKKLLTKIFSLIKKILLNNIASLSMNKVLNESIEYKKKNNRINGYTAFIEAIIFQGEYGFTNYKKNTIDDYEIALYSMTIIDDINDYEINLNNCEEEDNIIHFINTIIWSHPNEKILEILGLSKDNINNFKNSLKELVE